MTINKEGFLSEEIKLYRNQVISKHRSLFELGKEVNQFVHEVKYNLKIHNEDLQEMITGCALIKLHNNFQSIYILSTHGLIPEGKIVLRSMLEILFILKLCCDDRDFIDKYVMADQVYRQKLLNAAKNNPDKVFDETRQYATDEKLNEIKADIGANAIQELKIEELAKKAGMRNYYDSAYRLLSNPVHSGARSLERYLMFNKDNKLIALNFGPMDDDIGLVMVTAIDSMCIGLVSIFGLFKIDQTNVLENFQKRAIALQRTRSK